MLHFSDMAVGEISLIANENHDSLIVLVETAEVANTYTTSTEPGAATIFDNLHAKWNETLELDETRGANLAVLSYDNSFVRDTTPSDVLARIEKDVSKLSKKMKINPANVGIIICSAEITRSCFKNGFDFINVLIANASDKRPRKAFPMRLPFDSEFAWTNSVPAWLWTRSGGVKDEASGVNLLGFVVRAGAVVLYRQTEGSIYRKMRNFHKGFYGKLVLIRNLKQFEAMMRDWRKKKFNSLDTETDNLNRVHGNTLLAIQSATLNTKDDIPKMWVLPMEHSETPWNAKQLKHIKETLKYYFEFECTRQTHVYQNQKFDVHQFMQALKIRWYAAKFYDVMAGAFSLEENQKIMKDVMQISPYSLEHIERTFEYERPIELVIKKADRDKMASFSMREIADYGIIDVLTPLWLMFEQLEIARNRGYPNFFRFITRQLGPMVYAMTEMEHNGISIDLPYLKSIASPIGPLAERIRQVAGELAAMPSAQKANKRLLKKANFQKQGLFGKATAPQLWSIRDKKHLQMLFFDILELMPLSFLKDETGKLDKIFQKVYRYTSEVAKFTTYNKLTKLKSAFADAILKFMLNDPDMKHDIRLRPVFGYLFVLSGRSSTTRPSSQQLPQHGKDAKIIKSQFRVKKGKIILKSDYAGHEVRVSGNLSLDPAICRAVDEVNLRLLMYRRASDPQEVIKLRDLLTDLHVQNYKTFFDVDIGKKDPRRQDAKTAVFAVTYGSKEKAIGEKMRTEALYALEDELENSKNPKDDSQKRTDKQIEKLKHQVAYLKTEAAVEEYLEKASNLLEVLRERWGVLTKHIIKQQRLAKRNNVVFGPHGRTRHLWGYLHFDRFVHFAMDRRVFNSQGQGYASDIGFLGIYLAKKAYWDLFISRGLDIDVMQTNAVHDSSFNEVAFQFLPLAVYIQEHAMLTLTERYYRKHFGITNKTNYGADFEIGLTDADMSTWDGRLEGLVEIIDKYGPEAGLSKEEIEDVKHDAKILGNLRFHELHQKNPYIMTLEKQEVWDNIIPRLRCFKNHFKKKNNVVDFPKRKELKHAA